MRALAPEGRRSHPSKVFLKPVQMNVSRFLFFQSSSMDIKQYILHSGDLRHVTKWAYITESNSARAQNDTRRYFIRVQARLSILRADHHLYNFGRTPVLGRLAPGNRQLRHHVHYWHQDRPIGFYSSQRILHRDLRHQLAHLAQGRSIVFLTPKSRTGATARRFTPQ
jgi:hypothetical protein